MNLIPEAFASQWVAKDSQKGVVELFGSDLAKGPTVEGLLEAMDGAVGRLIDHVQLVVRDLAAGTESEQMFRARVFEQRHLVRVLDEASLTPKTLAAAADAGLAAPPPAEAGALEAVAMLARDWFAAHFGSPGVPDA